jgi:hypothetical protein
MRVSIFMGYPIHPPAVAEIMRRVAASRPGGHEYVTWESLENAGRIVMATVVEAIDHSELCIFDLTRPNPNVLFEAGYAIARAKPVWFTVDTTVSDAKRNWNDLALLKPVAYVGYRNSHDLVARLESDDPVVNLTPLYDEIIDPVMPDGADRTSLLYCPPYAPYEAANQLSSLVNDFSRRGLQVTTADPQETSLNTISWYAPKLASAAGILVNFAGNSRLRAEPHNQRNALIAGMALGFEIDTLMVAEGDYVRPFDYQDLLHVYDTAAQCVRVARTWLEKLDVQPVRGGRQRQPVNRLNNIRFGEHVAENEQSDLTDYFVETAAYRDVIRARDTLFVGHRGTGKTANALQAFNQLASNRENLVVLIKPSGFEFPGLLAAIDALPEFTHEYLFDSLWRFVIQTEIAATVLNAIDDRPQYIPAGPGEEVLLEYLQSAAFDVRSDIAVRLDQALQNLRAKLPDEVNVESGRVIINEAFHATALAELRHLLGPVLKDRRRVAVFIDNLDKGWGRDSRLSVLARLILGLLTARGHLVTDFARQDWWRDRVALTVAIFLRSDIFAYVKRVAREPDKLSTSTIKWNDPEILLSILQERVDSTWTGKGSPPRLWGDIFPGRVDGIDTSKYITSVVLPRPRDLVFLCNDAISRAIDRRHETVEPEDIEAAANTYSQYAYEALLVENGVTIPEMTSVLFAFLSSDAVVSGEELNGRIQSAGIDDARVESVRARLLETSFLGIETSENHFQYPEIGAGLDRALALSARLQSDTKRRRFRVHSAFHRFLEIVT